MNKNVDKIAKEKEYHNERFSHDVDPRAHLNRWYNSVRHGAEKQNQYVVDNAKGKRILEYGCANGALSLHDLKLHERSKTMTGIDISDVAINKASQLAQSMGCSNATFFTMDAEAMSFPNDSFDLIFGRGILHHLDLKKSYGELARVLAPNGVAIFSEPMGHNYFLNRYRSKTPDMRTEDEHPLLVSDFALAQNYFQTVTVEYFGFFSVLSALFSTYPNGLLYKVTKVLDSIFLRLPFVGRYAWHCLIILQKKS